MKKVVFLLMLCLAVVFSNPQVVGAKEDIKLSDSDIAIVGKYRITVEEFLRDINVLHMSTTVGKAIRGDLRAFPKQDYRKFLDQRIESKLILIESEKLGIDKEKDIADKIEFKRINLLLDRLRDEEINNKVEVTDKEILEYFIDDVIEKKKEKLERENSLEKPHQAQESKAGEEEKASEEVTPALEFDEKARAEIGATIKKSNYDAIKEGFVRLKTKQRETAYFNSLKKKARIKVYKKVVKKMTEGDVGYADSTIVKVNGKKITARYIWVRLGEGRWKDAKNVRAMIDSVVLHQLLDDAAQKKGYEKEEKFISAMLKFKEMTLVEVFKGKVVGQLIKVSDEEIQEYYDMNRVYFKYPDEVKLSVIKVSNKQEALDIIEELELGSDFAYLAREKSLAGSRVKGGDLGWVKVDTYPGLDIDNIRSVSKGSIAGPFRDGYNHVVLQLNGYREGKVMPLDEIRRDVDIIVGKSKVQPALDEYIERLRESTPIVYNKAKLSEFGINIE